LLRLLAGAHRGHRGRDKKPGFLRKNLVSEGQLKMSNVQGLSEAEVVARRARGLGNDVQLGTSLSYVEILRRNALTFINMVLFSLGVVLILMGRLGDAVVTAGLVLMNVVVGVVQEGRAKRTLDQIALLTRPRATVVREGQARTLDPSEIVLGDVLALGPGDQVVVDGQIIGEGCIEVDESLLTGESDLIPKQAGDAVYSGSFCVTGSAVYEAQEVGGECLANQLTLGARAFRQVKTPLQQDVDLVIRVLVFLAAQLGIFLALSAVLKGLSVVESVQVAAVIASLVPQGLFAMITLAYAMAAVRIAGQGALVQRANAVESLSNVSTLCLDKTGTLTTNRIQLRALRPVGVTEDELRRLLGDYVASASSANRTAEAIAVACGGQARPVRAEVPFSSARKWSALAFDDGALRGTFVLGAPEMIQPYLQADQEVQDYVQQRAARGLRVLLFAHRSQVRPLHDGNGEPQLPPDLAPLGVLSFSDELRPEAQATLRGFGEAGVQLKIISGDSPHTVAALAQQAGLGPDIEAVSGLELAEMDEAQLAQTVEEATIFGRITPQQKEQLVRALRARGDYVAMIGDGVNDVLSLKQAHLGIAMQSGSQAARSVADIVLLNDSFAVLPAAFREGQRIVNGMQDIVRLFLTRTFYVTFLILGAAIVGVAFPVTPKHNSILALLTVGIPTLALAAWARPDAPPPNLLRSVSHFVFPASFTVGAVAIAVYLAYLQATDDLLLARTALTTTTVLCGLTLIPFVEPPTPAWVGGDELSGDWRPIFLALGMLVFYGVVMGSPSLRESFELASLRGIDWALIAGVVLAWGVVLRFAWRRQFFERWLGERVNG
jgi:cation-transporting ATPase E